MAMMAATALPAVAQNRRQRLTQTLRETEMKLQKAATEAEKQNLRDQAEACRHELGAKDAAGRDLTWEISYQKTLVAQLDKEIAEMEGLAKGGWGLQPMSEDLRRGCRVLARSLVLRGGAEQDGNERNRYGFAGMLLVHNAEVLDALAGEVAVVEEARKAVPDGNEHNVRRGKLDRGLGAARDIIDLSRRVQSGQMSVGHGELRRLADRLNRIRESVEYLKAPPPSASPPPGPSPEQQARRRADLLATRITAIEPHQKTMAADLLRYLDLVRFGLTQDQTRGLAMTLLGYMERGVTVCESITSSPIADEAYRDSRLETLGAAVAKMGDRATRNEGYRTLRDLENNDRIRRRLETFPTPRPPRSAILRGVMWAQDVLRTRGDDEDHRRAGKIRGAAGQLAWRGEQFFANEKPKNRYLLAAYRHGMKELESRLYRAGETVAQHAGDAERALWDAHNTINELEGVRQTDSAMKTLARYTTVSDTIGKRSGVLALQLFDTIRNNDGPARNRLRDYRDAFTLARDFYQSQVRREDLAGAAKMTRGKYYPAFRMQAGKIPVMLMGLFEGNRDERNILRETLVAYRLTASVMILARAESDARMDLCRAGRQITMAPDRVLAVRKTVAPALGPVFAELGRLRGKELGDLIRPIRNPERVCRTAAAALRELQRDPTAADPLRRVIDNLRQTGYGDPGGETRQRWEVSWHLNQALEAYARGFPHTGDYHASRLDYRNPLYNVSLERQKGKN